MADTDLEMMILALKAAGIEGPVLLSEPSGHQYVATPGGVWNPLIDDGDALRLAVKLRIKFRYNEALGQALAWTGGVPDFEARANIEDCGRDEVACARLAIVRAAAEIGRAM